MSWVFTVLKFKLTASRESAFVYSVTAAAVVHELTHACSRNKLTNCTCVTNHKEKSQKDFDWGGCSDNIAFGLRFAKLFVDSVEHERDPRAKMNLHNNLAGRRVSELVFNGSFIFEFQLQGALFAS